MNIRVRVDDFPQGIPNKRCADADYHLLRELEVRQIPYVLGVVPELVCDMEISFLRTLKHAKIAMHGFNHSLDNWKIPLFEFRGLLEDHIEPRVEKGLRILSCFQVDWFIPPFNMFSQELVNVLAKQGFKTISAGHETLARMKAVENIDVNAMDFHGMSLVYSFLPYYTSKGDFKNILEMGRLCPADQQITFHLGGEYTY